MINARASACCQPPASTWGLSLLLFLFIGGTLYAGGGLAYNVKSKGAPVAKESLPQYELWIALYGLTLDGCAFTTTRIMRSKAAHLTRKLLRLPPPVASGYAKLGAASTPGELSPAAAGGGGAGTVTQGMVEAGAWAKTTGEEEDNMFGEDSSSSSSDDDSDLVE